MAIPVFGIDEFYLDKESGLAYDVSPLSGQPDRHTHNFYEIFIVADGSAFHMINNSVQTVEQGDICFIRPHDAHCYNFCHSDTFKIHNLAFTEQVFQNVALFLNQPQKLKNLLTVPFPSRTNLAEPARIQVIEYMNKVGHKLAAGQKNKARHLAQCIIALFLEDYFWEDNDDNSLNSSPKWLTDLLTEMKNIENLHSGYEKMCRLAPCSPSHLCRIMRQLYGQSPTQFINNQRLNYSVYLLTQTDMDILTISETCGFTNLSHFYHLFKNKFEKSPAKFRAANK